jgi:hypothetical protein
MPRVIDDECASPQRRRPGGELRVRDKEIERQAGLREDPPPIVYIPYQQFALPFTNLVVRSGAPEATVISAAAIAAQNVRARGCVA